MCIGSVFQNAVYRACLKLAEVEESGISAEDALDSSIVHLDSVGLSWSKIARQLAISLASPTLPSLLCTLYEIDELSEDRWNFIHGVAWQAVNDAKISQKQAEVVVDIASRVGLFVGLLDEEELQEPLSSNARKQLKSFLSARYKRERETFSKF